MDGRFALLAVVRRRGYSVLRRLNPISHVDRQVKRNTKTLTVEHISRLILILAHLSVKCVYNEKN